MRVLLLPPKADQGDSSRSRPGGMGANNLDSRRDTPDAELAPGWVDCRDPQ
jgi:hypothetical protein